MDAGRARSRRWVGLAGLTVIAFVVAAVLDFVPAVDAWNRASSIWLQGPATYWLTLVSSGVAVIFSGQVILAAALLVGIGLWLAGYKEQALALAGIFATVLVEVILKDWLRRPSPQGVLQIRTLIYVAVGPHFLQFSFPSGHVAREAFVLGWVGLWLVPPRCRGLALWVLGIVVAAVAWDRIYAGDHWLMDVIAGFLLAVFFLAATQLLHWHWLRQTLSGWRLLPALKATPIDAPGC
ncbi:MAG: phosphatase PAP2 family protein [Chloroflexota bacterium]